MSGSGRRGTTRRGNEPGISRLAAPGSDTPFRMLFDHSMDGVLLTRPDGQILAANAAACRMLGRTEEEICRLGRQGLIDPSDPRVAVLVSERDRTGSARGTMSFLKADGTSCEIEASSVIFQDGEGGDVTSMIMRDVTELRQAEAALRASEEKYRRIVETSAVGVCETDGQLRIRSVNERFARMLLTTRAEMIGEPAERYLFPEDGPDVEARKRERRAGLSGRYERRLRRADGSALWTLVYGTPLLDEAGRFAGALAVFVDLSDRKAAEDALRAAHRRLLLYDDSAARAVVEWDAALRITRWSRSAERMFGWSPAEAMGWRIDELPWIHEGDRPGMARVIEDMSAGRRSSGTFEGRGLRKDGAELWCEWYHAPLYDASGRLECVQLRVQDVTEKHLADEQIRGFSRTILSIREEEKRRLSTVLHHDTGSLAVGVMARLGAVEEDLNAGRVPEALESLAEARRLFERSVADLKSLAFRLRPPDLDLLGLAPALRQHFANMTREAALRIRFTDSSRGLPIDRDLATVLFRIAQEALNNVVRHAGATQVRVRFDATKSGCRLSIRDDGRGFEPRLVLDSPGRHIGILSMREMALGLGGKLEIESGPGQGTKVIAMLPNARSES